MVVLLALGACSGAPTVRVSNVGWSDAAGAMRAVIGVTDANGDPVQLGPKTVVTVETGDGGAFDPATGVVVDLAGVDLVDVAVVIDNSGSEEQYLAEIQDAVAHFAHTLLARNPADRIGLVRVSTEAHPWLALTSEETAIESAVDDLFVTNGWTALWDGIRVANDLLAEVAVEADATGTCVSGSFAAIVAFTDGQDNNSADEHASDAYPGDGIATTTTDAGGLRVFDAITPVFTVGVGDRVDEPALEQVATDSAGDYVAIRGYGMLEGALHGTAGQLSSQVPVCFLPADCAHTVARITVESGVGKNAVEGDTEIAIPPTCP